MNPGLVRWNKEQKGIKKGELEAVGTSSPKTRLRLQD